jgi:hypothetical protein
MLQVQLATPLAAIIILHLQRSAQSRALYDRTTHHVAACRWVAGQQLWLQAPACSLGHQEHKPTGAAHTYRQRHHNVTRTGCAILASASWGSTLQSGQLSPQ